MCGRFVVAGASSDLVALFDVDLPADNLPAPSWNIAPTDPVSIVLDSIPKTAGDDIPVRRLEAARWGLVPGWAKDPKVGVTAFNARIETLGEKAHFKNAIRKRRAIVPATGYYEWHTVGSTKTPHFIHLPDAYDAVYGHSGTVDATELYRVAAAHAEHGSQLRQRAHGTREIFLRNGRACLGLHFADSAGEFLFFIQPVELLVRCAGESALILLLLNGEDVRGALGAREQVLAVVGIEEFSERFDTADD